jgi:hypothetical protein
VQARGARDALAFVAFVAHHAGMSELSRLTSDARELFACTAREVRLCHWDVVLRLDAVYR